MALTEIQQFIQTLKQSDHILVTFKKDYTVDSVGSALAIFSALKKMNKKVDVVCDNFEPTNQLHFLPELKKIKPALTNLQKFVIEADIEKNKIEEFSYDLQDNKLKIFITPKTGQFTKEDFETKTADYKYDLIITIDTADLASLGNVYKNSAEFFYNTTIVNIDHGADNEHYGQINLTNMNACATSEIVYGLIKELGNNLTDQDIATYLLTGMISKTRSFKTTNVTPKTLEIAGALIELGGQKDAIIKSLYRSRNLATLNLWGRVLARLKSSDNNKIVWSLITEDDFIASVATPQQLPDVVEELITFVPGVEIIVLIYQAGPNSKVIVNTSPKYNALYLTSKFQGQGNKQLARIEMANQGIQETEKQIIEEIQQKFGQK